MELSYRYSTPLPILKNIITTKDFNLLLAEEQLNPRGEERADFRSAMICVSIAKMTGNKNAKLTDFMPVFDNHKKEVSKEEGCLQLATLFNTLKRGENGNNRSFKSRVKH